MNAFGVKLAAGAVTVMLGAVMAAQAQKDQQENTESAWTEQQIPPGKSASPIGLLAADPSDAENLVPFADQTGSNPENGSDGVTLVQHTESMTLPSDETDASAQRAPKMTMSLPSFDDAPPMDDASLGSPQDDPTLVSDAADGPSGAIGMPIAEAAAETPPAAMMSAPSLSAVTFADTPQANEEPAPATELPEPPASNGETPSNGLRSGTPASMRSDPAFDRTMATLESPETADAAPMGPQDDGDAVAESPKYVGSINASSLVVPEANESAPAAGNEFASSPGATMRIQSNPPVQLGIGEEPASAIEDAATPPPSTPSAASPQAIGFASQPQIVGGSSDQMSYEFDAASQPAPASATVPQGNPGFATPENFAMTGTGGYPPAPNLPPPQASPNGSAYDPPAPLGGAVREGQPSMGGIGAPNAFATPGHYDDGQSQPFHALPMDAQAQPLQQGQTANTPGAPGSIYHAAGYKQRNADSPLPPGPTTAAPGDRHLDGPQSPSVVIHKRAPAEVKVGKPASFVLTVKNVGGSKALDVQVHDRVPTGMTLTDATPRPNPKFQPELFWELGDLEPGQERTITLQLTPEQEGELGSVARVTFHAAASVRTISTRPELKIVQRAPEKVLIGQQLEIELEVSNPGTGEATGVLLQEDVPAGLEHPQGKQLDNLIGRLGPGEIRRQILRMRAVKPGIVQNQIRVKGDDGLETTHTVAVEVVAPELKVTMSGPSRRYLERQATYDVEIANVGSADATNVELSVQLDRGFTFVKTDFEGQYDPSRHAVFWSLPSLPVGQSGKVPLTLLPVEEGNRVIRGQASADLGINTTATNEVSVESLAELTFSIHDSADPIEIGGETTFEIRVSNTGSRDDTNVQVAMQLPQGLQLVEQGDFTPKGQGIIEFTPRGLLKANDEMVFQVKARGAAPGRHLIKTIVTSDQSDVPVTKEESIKVYSDR